MNIVTPTADRVANATDDEVAREIRRQTDENVARTAAGGCAAIERRLDELDYEWDIERCLETGASSLTLLGTLLGATVDRRWYLLPVGVAAFLLQHAIQGWCPPLPLFRRLGIRTADEIAEERYALKALRGDFAGIEGVQAGGAQTSPAKALAAVRR